MIYFSSDFHFGHKNICGPKVSSWKDGYRDFDSIEEMDNQIIENVNNLVGVNDTLYFLGDFCFSNPTHFITMVERINCKDIHFILGNHDASVRDNRHDQQDFFSSVSDYKVLKHNKTRFILSHYAFEVWDRSHHGAIHLYGHSHGSLPEGDGLRMDVGIDSIKEKFGDYRPISIDEVEKYMESKQIKYVDHHETR